jgi:hypothetical protein
MRIFVQIASYRDPQLIPTINDLVRKAARPQAIRFGICRQYDRRDGFDDLAPLRMDSRFRVIDVPSRHSCGACWARSMAQGFFSGEEFTLQIDSHMRFVPRWDETLIRMLRQLIDECGIPKPVLTTYPPHFDPGKFLDVSRPDPPSGIVLSRFMPEGPLVTMPDLLPGWRQLRYPVRARFFAGGFAFTLGRLCWEVPYDPQLYFIGEEITMAVRAFTHGYDLFHPHKTVLWHYYTRAGHNRHWDDHPDWYIRNAASVERMRQLLGMSRQAPRMSFGRYGLGKARTLRQYELYAGISFSRRAALG